LSFASLAPEVGEVVLIVTAPGIEVVIWWEFWVIAEEFEERDLGS
jgi:hypothetical protein